MSTNRGSIDKEGPKKEISLRDAFKAFIAAAKNALESLQKLENVGQRYANNSNMQQNLQRLINLPESLRKAETMEDITAVETDIKGFTVSDTIFETIKSAVKAFKDAFTSFEAASRTYGEVMTKIRKEIENRIRNKIERLALENLDKNKTKIEKLKQLAELVKGGSKKNITAIKKILEENSRLKKIRDMRKWLAQVDAFKACDVTWDNLDDITAVAFAGTEAASVSKDTQMRWKHAKDLVQAVNMSDTLDHKVNLQKQIIGNRIESVQKRIRDADDFLKKPVIRLEIEAHQKKIDDYKKTIENLDADFDTVFANYKSVKQIIADIEQQITARKKMLEEVKKFIDDIKADSEYDIGNKDPKKGKAEKERILRSLSEYHDVLETSQPSDQKVADLILRAGQIKAQGLIILKLKLKEKFPTVESDQKTLTAALNSASDVKKQLKEIQTPKASDSIESFSTMLSKLERAEQASQQISLSLPSLATIRIEAEKAKEAIEDSAVTSFLFDIEEYETVREKNSEGIRTYYQDLLEAVERKIIAIVVENKIDAYQEIDKLKQIRSHLIQRTATGIVDWDRALFLDIPESEFSELKDEKCPAFKKAATAFNKLSLFVQNDILKHESIEERVLAMERWVDIMKSVHHEGDFNALYAIDAAFQSASLFRLSSTRGGLSESAKTFLDEVDKLKKQMRTSGDNVIPYIGTYRTELVGYKEKINESQSVIDTIEEMQSSLALVNTQLHDLFSDVPNINKSEVKKSLDESLNHLADTFRKIIKILSGEKKEETDAIKNKLAEFIALISANNVADNKTAIFKKYQEISAAMNSLELDQLLISSRTAIKKNKQNFTKAITPLTAMQEAQKARLSDAPMSEVTVEIDSLCEDAPDKQKELGNKMLNKSRSIEPKGEPIPSKLTLNMLRIENKEVSKPLPSAQQAEKSTLEKKPQKEKTANASVISSETILHTIVNLLDQIIEVLNSIQEHLLRISTLVSTDEHKYTTKTPAKETNDFINHHEHALKHRKKQRPTAGKTESKKPAGRA